MPTECEQVLTERYRIESLISRGGMGAVYRAWDLRLNIPVALKEMLPQPDMDEGMLEGLRHQFQQEAEILARLQHPNLVRVTDYFSVEKLTYLVMDFVEGISMAGLINRDGPRPESQVLGWAEQLLNALAYCHSYGIYHRDIKPHNVIIRSDGVPILVDFGLVKFWNPDNPHTRTVLRGMATPQYAPPEQYDLGRGHTDARSDIYSLGATLYHALSGEAPPSATQRIADPEKLRPLRAIDTGVSGRTEAAIMKAVELGRGDRWPTASDMARALGVAAPHSEAVTAAVREDHPTKTQVLLAPSVDPGGGRSSFLWVWVAGAIMLSMLLCGGSAWAVSNMLDLPAFLRNIDAPATITPTAFPIIVADATDTPSPSVTMDPPTATSTVFVIATPRPSATSTIIVTLTPTQVPTEEATSTATTTPQSIPTATPEPASTQPQLVSPVGGEHRNPISFSWQGALLSGQSYRLVSVHSESGVVVQGDGLSSTNWAADLPAENYGEWRWRVSVVSGGAEMTTSEWRTFIFNPLPGVGPGESDGPLPTPSNTPPSPEP